MNYPLSEYGYRFGKMNLSEFISNYSGFNELNRVTFALVVVASIIALYSALRKPEKFWFYFSALGLAVILAITTIWFHNELFEAGVIRMRRIAGGLDIDRWQGDLLYPKVNSILQSMIGVFMMTVALLIRKPSKGTAKLQSP